MRSNHQYRKRERFGNRSYIRSVADTAESFQKYINSGDLEHFVVAALNTKHVINVIHTT